jgi:putative inorganic carbon (hco3(-)) transporter
MRDIAVVLFAIGSAIFGLIRPWIGVLALAVLAYLNPHRYAWGFSRSLPVYFVVFLFTCFGLATTKDRQRFPWTRETILFILLLAYYTFTTLWKPDFSNAAWEQWEKVMKIYIGIFPTLWLINTRYRIRWLVITIAISFGVIGLKGGVFSLLTGFQHRVWGPPDTFYGGNNEIALALSMTLPLLLLCAREVEPKWIKTFFWGMFGLSVLAIISTWSRGGLLALCAVVGAIVLTEKKKWLFVPIAVVAIALLLPRLPDKWFDRMGTIQNYQEDASAMSRLDSWQFSINRALKDPLTGGGFACFSNRTDSHSAYFQILAHHGFIALSLWLSLLFGTMIALERLRRRAILVSSTEWIASYARSIQISLLGYAIGSFFLGTAYWDYFYHLTAICAVLKIQLSREKNILELAESERKYSTLPIQISI